MAINKATLAKEIDGIIEYIYPKTSGDIVVYDETHSVSTMIQSLVNNKVDKEDNKGLSTNDFTNYYKNILDNYESKDDTVNITIDSTLSSSSENAVQNKVLTSKFNEILNTIGSTAYITGIGDGTITNAIKYVKDSIETSSSKNEESYKTLTQSIADVKASREPTHTIVAYTLKASGWENGKYSLEADYSSSKYNVYIDKGVNVTQDQNDALAAANISSSIGNNILTVNGTVPTIDIPVTLEVVDISDT